MSGNQAQRGGGDGDGDGSVVEEEDEEGEWVQRAAGDGLVGFDPHGFDPHSTGQPGVLRPGIVHRLDKGTTGLIVVAKDGPTHAGWGCCCGICTLFNPSV